EVHVFEKNAKPGGLLRYGIPDFKLEKHIVDRRVRQMEAEGVVFHCGVRVATDVSAKQLEAEFDAVLLTGGSEQPVYFFAKAHGRDFVVIHFDMVLLPLQNRTVSGENIGQVKEIMAKYMHVIVIGGVNTGSDCICTSIW